MSPAENDKTAKNTMLVPMAVKVNKKRKRKQEPSIEEAMPKRPGERRLRKLNYLRKELSTIDYIPLTALNTLFTGSVFLSSSVSMEDASVKRDQVTVITTNDPEQSITESPSQPLMIAIQPLLILDLNGILCIRPRSGDRDLLRPEIARIAGTPIIPRPHLFEFLHLLDQHFCLAVWTSAKSKTARKLVDTLFPKDIRDRLLFIWAQHHCTALKATDEEVIYQKDLEKVWEMYPVWNPTNTLIMDDSPDKCSKPANSLHPPPLDGLKVSSLDLDNIQKQRRFFEALAEFWASNPVTRKFEKDSVQDTYSLSQLEHLKHVATCHMGWKEE